MFLLFLSIILWTSGSLYNLATRCPTYECVLRTSLARLSSTPCFLYNEWKSTTNTMDQVQSQRRGTRRPSEPNRNSCGLLASACMQLHFFWRDAHELWRRPPQFTQEPQTPKRSAVDALWRKGVIWPLGVKHKQATLHPRRCWTQSAFDHPPLLDINHHTWIWMFSLVTSCYMIPLILQLRPPLTVIWSCHQAKLPSPTLEMR